MARAPRKPTRKGAPGRRSAPGMCGDGAQHHQHHQRTDRHGDLHRRGRTPGRQRRPRRRRPRRGRGIRRPEPATAPRARAARAPLRRHAAQAVRHLGGSLTDLRSGRSSGPAFRISNDAAASLDPAARTRGSSQYPPISAAESRCFDPLPGACPGGQGCRASLGGTRGRTCAQRVARRMVRIHSSRRACIDSMVWCAAMSRRASAKPGLRGNSLSSVSASEPALPRS